MKVMVCGSLGYEDNVQRIRELQAFLMEKNFKILDQLRGGALNYSHIRDFRDRKELATNIVEKDLELVKEADIVVAMCDVPSFGTAIELFVAKKLGKTVIAFSKQPVASPWPIVFSDYIVDTEENLSKLLQTLQNKKRFKA